MEKLPNELIDLIIQKLKGLDFMNFQSTNKLNYNIGKRYTFNKKRTYLKELYNIYDPEKKMSFSFWLAIKGYLDILKEEKKIDKDILIGAIVPGDKNLELIKYLCEKKKLINYYFLIKYSLILGHFELTKYFYNFSTIIFSQREKDNFIRYALQFGRLKIHKWLFKRKFIFNSYFSYSDAGESGLLGLR